MVMDHPETPEGEAVQDIYSFRIVDRQGKVKWVDVNAVIISWEGRPATLNFFTDITMRKLADEAIRRSEERYRTIFENAVEGIFQTTVEGKFLSVNPALARMFGFSSAGEMIETVQHLGKEVYADPADRERVLESLWREGKLEGHEFEVCRRDGTRFWVSINVHLVRDPGQGTLHRGHQHGHHQPQASRGGTQQAGSSAPAGPEDGVGGSPCGRSRPRLQQHADTHHGICGDAPG
jgi:PAS domain S-box-containing protein